MNDRVARAQESESKPVRALGAVGAALLTVVSALSLVDGVPQWLPAIVGVLGLGITAFVTSYTQKRTTPYDDVVAKITPAGKIVAGPAAETIPNGAVVAVVPDPPRVP